MPPADLSDTPAGKPSRVLTMLFATVALGLAAACLALWVEQRRTAAARDQALAAEAEARADLRAAQEAVDECYELARDDSRMQAEHLRPLRKLILRQTLPYYQRAVAQAPADSLREARQAVYLMRVAYITAELGDPAEGVRLFRQAEQVMERLSLDNPELALTLGHLRHYLGDLYRRHGQLAEAQAAVTASLGQFLRLAAADPKGVGPRNGLGWAHYNLGQVFDDQGKPREAVESYRAALDAWRLMYQEHPDLRQDEFTLAHCWTNLGAALHKAGRPRDAVGCYDTACDMWVSLQIVNPSHAHIQVSLGAVYANLGAAHSDLGEPRRAALAYQRATDLQQPLAQAYPDVGEYQAAAARTWTRLGRVHLGMGQAGDAGPCLEKARECSLRLASGDAAGWYALARAYAVAAGHERAMECLERAREAGYFGTKEAVQAAHTEADLNPLRGRADFTAWLAGLGAKK